MDDFGHKFKIGDVVRMKGTAPNCNGRFLVYEQHVQRCYGGTQLSYYCFAIRADGPVSTEHIQFVESVLEPSEPFTDRRSISEWSDISERLKGIGDK